MRDDPEHHGCCIAIVLTFVVHAQECKPATQIMNTKNVPLLGENSRGLFIDVHNS